MSTTNQRDIKLNNIDQELKKIHDEAIGKEAALKIGTGAASKTNNTATNNRESFSNILTPDLIKAKKEQEEITRREYLEKSKQYVFIAKEKEDIFWNGQNDRFKAIANRAELAKTTTENISQLLNKRATSFTQFYMSMKDVQSYAINERSTMRDSAISFELLRKSSIEEFDQLKERVFNVAYTNSQGLNTDIAKRAKFLENTGKELLSEINTQRNKVWNSWVAYEKAATLSIKSKLIGGNPEEVIHQDPVVLGRVYRAESDKLKLMSTTYAEKMSKLFIDLKLTDGRRIDASKTNLLDHLLAEKQLLQTQLKLTEQAIASVKSIDREKDVIDWVKDGKFLIDDQGHSIFELIPPNSDKKNLLALLSREVCFEGKLGRQGRLFITSWTDAYCILTRSGYFHYFDDINDPEPSFSLLLSDVTISIANPIEFGENVILFSQPNKSFFSLGNPNLYYFHAKSQDNMVDWMIYLKNYCYIPEVQVSPSAPVSIIPSPTLVSPNPAEKVASAQSSPIPEESKVEEPKVESSKVESLQENKSSENKESNEEEPLSESKENAQLESKDTQ